MAEAGLIQTITYVRGSMSVRRRFGDATPSGAEGRSLNIPLEFRRGNLKKVSGFWSGIDPVGALLAEHLEDDAAVMLR